MMKWGDFKKCVEGLGVNDKTEVLYIDVSGLMVNEDGRLLTVELEDRGDGVVAIYD